MGSDIKIEDVQARIAEAREHAADARGPDWWSMLASALAADAETLLASHRVLAEAGEEMPNDGARAFAESYCDKQGERRTGRYEAAFAGFKAGLDASAPILARRTQERNEARNELADVRANVREAEKAAHLRGLKRAEEVDAFRQRAERAEREHEASEGAWPEATGCAGPEDARREMSRLRARVAELESRPEPSADVVEMLAVVRHRAVMMALDPATDDVDVEYDRHQASPEQIKADLAGIRAVVSALAERGEDVCHDALGYDTPWPTALCLKRLVDAADHLLNDHDCDAHGWEGLALARDSARGRVDALACLSPVIGALRGRVAELEAKANAQRTALDVIMRAAGLAINTGATLDLGWLTHRCADGLNGTKPARVACVEPRPDDDPDGVAEAARLGRL